MHFLILFVLVLVGVNNDSITEAQTKATKSYRQISLVAAQRRIDCPFDSGVAEDQEDTGNTSFERSNFSGSDSSKHQDERREQSLEVLRLSSHDQGQGGILSELRKALDEVYGWRFHSHATFHRVLGLGRHEYFKGKKETKQKQVQQGSEERKRRQSEWEGKGAQWKVEGRKDKRIDANDLHSPFAICPISGSSSSWWTLGYRTELGSVTNFTSDNAFRQCRFGGSFSEGLSQQGANASRSEGTHREDTTPRVEVSYERPSPGDLKLGEGTKTTDRNSGSQESTQDCLAQSPHRIRGAMEQATAGLCCSTVHVDGEGNKSSKRYSGCDKGHPEPQHQGGGLTRGSCTPGPSHEGGCITGSGGRGAQEEAQQTICRLCDHGRYPNGRCTSHTQRWRRRRREEEEETTIHRARGRKRRWTWKSFYYAYGYIVISGRARTCPSGNDDRMWPKTVKFDPVVEAYDTSGCCAASYSFENFVAFPFGELKEHIAKIDNRDCHFEANYLGWMSHSYAEGLEACRIASLWSFLAISDGLGLPVLHCRALDDWDSISYLVSDMEAQTYESSKWGWKQNPREPSSALVDLSWNCRDDDSMDGCVRSLKPNPGILEGIDATVPYRHRTQDGFVFTGRTIPPPNWEQHPLLRSAANYGAVHRNLDGELNVLIRSWIAARQEHLVLQHRDFTIRAQLMHEVESKIRQFWPDYILPDDLLTLTRVRPAPNIGHRGQRPLHILVEVNREDGSTWQPILMANREINEHGPSNVIRWTPALVPPNIDMITVHALCAPPCAAQQMLIPHPGRVRRWLVLGQNRPATAGLFLPLWWDRRLQVPQGDAYEEDDQQVLLQTSSGEKDWYANCKLLDNWYEATTLSSPQHLEREGEAQEDLSWSRISTAQSVSRLGVSNRSSVSLRYLIATLQYLVWLSPMSGLGKVQNFNGKICRSMMPQQLLVKRWSFTLMDLLARIQQELQQSFSVEPTGAGLSVGQ